MGAVAEHQIDAGRPALRIEAVRPVDGGRVAQRGHGGNHQHRSFGDVDGSSPGCDDGRRVRRVAPLTRCQRRIQPCGFEEDRLQLLLVPVGSWRTGPLETFGCTRRGDRRVEGMRAAQQLLQDPARGERIGWNEAGSKADKDRPDLPIGERRIAPLGLQQALKQAVRHMEAVVVNRAVDQCADSRCAVQGQLSRRRVTEGICEQQRRDRHRPFGELVGIIDPDAKILPAGLGRDTRDQVLHHVDAAAG